LQPPGLLEEFGVLRHFPDQGPHIVCGQLDIECKNRGGLFLAVLGIDEGGLLGPNHQFAANACKSAACYGADLFQGGMDLPDRAVTRRMKPANASQAREVGQNEIQVTRWLAAASIKVGAGFAAWRPLFAVRVLLRPSCGESAVTPALLFRLGPPGIFRAKDVFDLIVEQDHPEFAAGSCEVLNQVGIGFPFQRARGFAQEDEMVQLLRVGAPVLLDDFADRYLGGDSEPLDYLALLADC
jgi:hypothetical protein